MVAICCGGVDAVVHAAIDLSSALKGLARLDWVHLTRHLPPKTVGASLLAMAIMPLTTAFALSEAFGFESGVDRKLHEAPIFYGIFTAILAVGAGDALLAYSTLAMVVARDATQATILGSIAAACECEFDGNIPISPDNVRAKLNSVENQLHYRA